MLNMLVKNICENSNKIDSLTTKVKKSSTRVTFQILLLSIGMYAIAKTIKDQQSEINTLKEQMNNELRVAKVELKEVDMA